MLMAEDDSVGTKSQQSPMNSRSPDPLDPLEDVCAKLNGVCTRVWFLLKIFFVLSSSIVQPSVKVAVW